MRGAGYKPAVQIDQEGPPLETTPCAICGTDDAAFLLAADDNRRHVPGTFRVVRCRKCGLVYLSPRPTPAGIGRYYPPDYSYHEAGPTSAARRFYYQLFRKPPVPPGARVLDVGCGGGSYLLHLRAQGYEVAGVEPNADLARRLGESYGLDVRPGELVDTHFPDASFDAVTFWWVLEHAHRPLDQLREAHRIIKPGGRVVVALQNFGSLARLCFGSSWHHIDVPTHLYQFEPATLRRAFEVTGFRPLRVRHDLLGKDFAPSLGYRLGLATSLDWWLPNAVALPFDLLSWATRRSSLITGYAERI